MRATLNVRTADAGCLTMVRSHAMAKQGQHKRDANDQRVSRGRNNPKESMTITTGTPKKEETYEEHARQRKDTDPEPQRAEPRWIEDTRQPEKSKLEPTRSGSESNASRRTRGH
jgi:hypothetical protein